MNGILNVLKPPGMTSHDVVSYIRKVTGIKKVGHTGTLDPGAAGILPICIGKSTKIVDYIMNDKKTYICELTLGNMSDTYDKYGELKYAENKACPSLDENKIMDLLKKFKGNISQKPPAYSAIKLGGKKAYELARQGECVDLPERKVVIYEIDLLKFNKEKIMLKITCSKGTYIRSICHDIGLLLGCGAYMNFLIRTSTGKFNLNNSFLLEEINKNNIEDILISPDFCLNMKSIVVCKEFKTKLLNGNSILLKDHEIYDNEFVKIYLSTDEFIGIGKVNNNILYVEKLLV